MAITIKYISVKKW